MKKVGQILKAERERRQLSLHEIGMSLKINPKTLSAIEEGDLKQLPAKTFLRGFVRSYAHFLKLNVDEVIQLFQEEMGSTHPEIPRPPTEGSPAVDEPPTQGEKISATDFSKAEKAKPLEESAFAKPYRSNRTGLIIISMVLVVMIVAVAKLVEKYQKERRDPEAAAALLGESGGEDSPDGPVDTTLDETTTTLSTEASALLLTTSTTLVPSSTTTTVPATTTTKPPTTTTTTKPPATTTTTTPPATTTTLSVNGRPVEVIVEALNKVSINYTLGNDAEKSLSLEAGQFHTFKSRSKVVLDINDGGSASVIVNGRDRGRAGAAGKSVKLTYP